jgi:hypothetical protein
MPPRARLGPRHLSAKRSCRTLISLGRDMLADVQVLCQSRACPPEGRGPTLRGSALCGGPGASLKECRDPLRLWERFSIAICGAAVKYEVAAASRSHRDRPSRGSDFQSRSSTLLASTQSRLQAAPTALRVMPTASERRQRLDRPSALGALRATYGRSNRGRSTRRSEAMPR